MAVVSCAVQSCAVRRNGRIWGAELERDHTPVRETSDCCAPVSKTHLPQAMATRQDNGVIVRRTQKEDLPEVIGMIQELADFEKMPDGPQLTVDDLIRDGGFDERRSADGRAAPPVFHSFVLEAPADPDDCPANQERLTSMRSVDPANARPLTRKLIGYAICYYAYSTWQGKSLALEDIYIRPAYRGNGYGELFFRALAKHAQDTNCSRIDFHVLSWNPATKFYHRMGAVDLTETEAWHFYRVPKDAIGRLNA
uniref:N-acetyltransferase domain-containing protein n=1 Tax=Anopheles stephensi TaxID=30069 RepID=A0A182Y4P5_ANOST